MTSYFEQIFEATAHKTTAVKSLTSPLKTIQDEQYMLDTDGEARTNSLVTFFYGPLHLDVSVLADQEELIYISFVQTQDAVWKTCRKRWTIGTDEEREPGKSVLLAQRDDEEIEI